MTMPWPASWPTSMATRSRICKRWREWNRRHKPPRINFRLAIDESGMRHLALSPAVAASYNKLVNLFQVQNNVARIRTGWLYLLPDSLLNKIIDLPHGNGVTITPQWIEDKACIACQGDGWVTCPECNGAGKLPRKSKFVPAQMRSQGCRSTCCGRLPTTARGATARASFAARLARVRELIRCCGNELRR